MFPFAHDRCYFALVLFQYSKDHLWIGPSLNLIAWRRFIAMNVCWGWDQHDPIRLLPSARVDRISDIRVYVFSWLGFTMDSFVMDLSDPYRMKAAKNLLDGMKIFEWNRS